MNEIATNGQEGSLFNIKPLEHSVLVKGRDGLFEGKFYEVPSAACKVDLTDIFSELYENQERFFSGILLEDNRLLYSASVPHWQMLQEMKYPENFWGSFPRFFYHPSTLMIYGDVNGPGTPEGPLELFSFLRGSWPQNENDINVIVARKQTLLAYVPGRLFTGTMGEARNFNQASA